MYEQYFGLARNPFNMTPDPALLYMTPSHREALAGLAYAILRCKGFVTMMGEAGTGKTSLLARTLRCLPANRVVSSVILNPSLSEDEFFELMLMDFGFADVPASKARRFLKFQEFLLRTSEAGKIAVLVVDEAHKISPSLLEEIRLISNLELPGQKLLQIVLAGQTELNEVLDRPDLRQLRQRIALRLTIQVLSNREVEEYIHLRWSKSGPSPVPFAADSFALIARGSRGIPRLVNSICDNALMLAFAEKAPLVEQRHVREACHDLCLSEKEPALKPPAVQTPAALNGASAPVAVRTPVIEEYTKPPVATAPLHLPAGPTRLMESYMQPRRSLWPRWMSTRRAAQ
jgi:general secretion pathway protein A